MRLKVLTHSSGEFETEDATFDAVTLNEQLNNTSINSVLIGNINIARIDVKLVSPVEE
jgi:hypothetical protein